MLRGWWPALRGGGRGVLQLRRARPLPLWPGGQPRAIRTPGAGWVSCDPSGQAWGGAALVWTLHASRTSSTSPVGAVIPSPSLPGSGGRLPLRVSATGRLEDSQQTPGQTAQRSRQPQTSVGTLLSPRLSPPPMLRPHQRWQLFGALTPAQHSSQGLSLGVSASPSLSGPAPRGPASPPSTALHLQEGSWQTLKWWILPG